MTRAVLGLGANLGDPRESLRAAVAGLAAQEGIEVLAVSALWRTAPVGGPDQPEYTNAVVLLSTALAPRALLAAAQRLEVAAARVREVHWGPRTLDVDILDIEGMRSTDPVLTVPHPRAHERAFVLVPWAQVDPDWILAPVGQAARPVSDWCDDLAGDPDQSVAMAEGGDWWR